MVRTWIRALTDLVWQVPARSSCPAARPQPHRPHVEQLEDRSLLDASTLALDPLKPEGEPVPVAAPTVVGPAPVAPTRSDATADADTLPAQGEPTLYSDDGDDPPVIATGEGITLFAANGNDSVTTVCAEVTLYSEDRDDPLPLATGEGITLFGEAGDDLLPAGGEVTLVSDSGNDPPARATGEGITLFGGTASDPLVTSPQSLPAVPLGTSGTLSSPPLSTPTQSTPSTALSTNTEVVLQGGTGDDLLIGTAGHDMLLGGIVEVYS